MGIRGFYFIVFIFVIFLPFLAISQDQGGDYAKAIQMADKYFNEEDYINAKASYQYASKLRPEESYPKEKLEATLDLIKVQMEKNARYAEKIMVADDLYARKDYDAALKVYKEAVVILPKNEYALQKILEIEKLRNEILAQDRDYDARIAAGETYIKSGSYPMALSEFKKASELKPAETYPLQKITELEALIQQEKEASGEFEAAVSAAEDFVRRKKYDEAIAKLEEAIRLKPEKSFPKQRLNEVRQLKNSFGDYETLISQADDLYINKEFSSARAKYVLALEMSMGNEYPQMMIEKIDIALMDIEAANQQSYEVAIAKADKFFSEEDYEKAIGEYNKALSFKPDASYARDRINTINKTLNLRKVQEEAYVQTISKADQQFDLGQLDIARDLYNEAIGYKPFEQYPKVRIQEIESLQRDQQNKRSLYDDLISGADKLFFSDNYEEAKVQYEKAIELFPVEKYPQDQVSMINEILGLRDSYIKAVTKADLLLYEKNYDAAVIEYRNAAGINPDEPYPGEKIREIETILAERNRQLEIQRQYDQLISAAAMNQENKEYQAALTKYEEAAALKPAESLPATKIKEINLILEGLAKQEETQNQYDQLILQADQHFEQKEYQQAIKAFQQASQLKTGEAYPLERIALINRTIEDIAKQDQLEKDYQNAISAADNLLQKASYEEALAAYRQASDLKPQESYPSDKITEINTMLARIAEDTRLEEQYQALVRSGDQSLSSKEYSGAKAYYLQASGMKPDEKYPQDKIREIDSILEELAAKELLENNFNGFVAEGNAFATASNFDEAINSYQKALELKPGDKTVLSLIDDARLGIKELDDKKKRDESYSSLIAKADEQVAVKNYTQAIVTYEEALKLKPGEAYPTQKILETRAIIDELAAQLAREEKYRKLVADADLLFGAKEYQMARENYQQALSLKTEEDYPKNRTGEIDKILDEIAASQEMEKRYSEVISRADGYYDTKDYNAALAAYEEALTIKSGDVYAFNRIREAKEALRVITEMESLENKYAGLIESADQLFSGGNLNEARDKYKEASLLKPNLSYPTEKIAEIDNELARIAREKENQKKYSEAIAYADKHFNNNDYANASYEYKVANSLKPEEPYPLVRLAAIDSIMAKQLHDKELNTRYAAAIKKGDENQASKEYELALNAFEEALGIKPDDLYAQKKVIEVKSIISGMQEEVNKSYDMAVNNGDNFFDQENYELAKPQYERAIELKPMETYPQNRLKETNLLLQKKRLQIQGEYDKAISDADKFYASKIYDNALDSYRIAADLISDEKYPQEMIRRILKIISERVIVDINRDPLLIKENQLEKFEFMPVAAKDRKSNYIFFKARSISSSNYKLIISFGKDGAKNGGMVVRIPAGSEYNDYIVRVSAQYRWFSEDNNWITIYPEGGDVEISLVQIAYSD